MEFLVFQIRTETRVLLVEAESFDDVRIAPSVSVKLITECGPGQWETREQTPLFESHGLKPK